MAMSTAQLAAISSTTSDTTSYNGTAGTPTAGDLLIAVVAISNSVSVGGLSGTFPWTLLGSLAAGGDTLYVYWAYADSATSVTPSFDCSDDAATGCAMQVFRLTGLDGQTQPYLRQIKFNSGNATNCTVTTDVAVQTGNGVIGACFKVDPSGLSDPTSWSNRGSASYSSPFRVLRTSYRNSGETGSSFTWSGSTSGAFIAFVAELYVAGAGISPVDDYGQNGVFGI